MITFNSAHLAKKPAEVFAAAREEGAIIRRMNTNGIDVLEEFVLLPTKKMIDLDLSNLGDGHEVHVDLESGGMSG